MMISTVLTSASCITQLFTVRLTYHHRYPLVPATKRHRPAQEKGHGQKAQQRCNSAKGTGAKANGYTLQLHGLIRAKGLGGVLGGKPEAAERMSPGYISALREVHSPPPPPQQQQTLLWPKPGPVLSSLAVAKIYSRAVREPLLPSPPAGYWNCHREQHRYQRCPYERGIFCFGCGRPAVRLSQCCQCVHAWRRGEIGPHDPPGQEPRLPPAEIV